MTPPFNLKGVNFGGRDHLSLHSTPKLLNPLTCVELTREECLGQPSLVWPFIFTYLNNKKNITYAQQLYFIFITIQNHMLTFFSLFLPTWYNKFCIHKGNF